MTKVPCVEKPSQGVAHGKGDCAEGSVANAFLVTRRIFVLLSQSAESYRTLNFRMCRCTFGFFWLTVADS